MSQLYFVVTRGHNGGEFLSYLINQSPDFENTGKLIYEEYPSFLGTHHRIDDDWNIHQWDEFTEYYNEYVRQREKPPYNLAPQYLRELFCHWQKVRRGKHLCLFLNVTYYVPVAQMVHRSNCKAIGSVLNLPNNTARHHHTMMEFDPNSTHADEGPNQQEYDYQALVDELVDWHKDEINHNYDHFDYVFDHSRITDMDYVLDMYKTLDIAPPTADHLQKTIINYYHKNRVQHEFTRKINQEILHF
tara:strand:+ start:864 stop:1598 length:735 start_codon:yes stop_codon:yes gene_type:complete